MEDRAKKRDSVAIIGLGKVGTAVGYLLKSAGYNIVAVAGRSLENLRQGASYTGGQVTRDNAEAASLAECVVITTGDDAIARVCEEISQKGALKAGKKVIHMSGAGGLNLLASARRMGAFVASIHPLQSFAHVEGAIKSIPGSTFGITADEEIRAWAVQMVRDLGGSPFPVADRDKPLYHAAACLASNYLTSLIYTVEEIYQSLGMERDEAQRAFWPLVMGTLENIETKGPVQALTGPIARGDAGTIEKHLTALRERLPWLLPLYCEMGLKTAEIGLKKKTLTPEKADIIKTLLKGGP
ncbi:MAG: DUF2520 domain-containing protein [Syntrophales bacterium LBB04]|nr:DUF2520 domain-containing protein [Syntrophales bacterium LBB04]